MVHFYSFFNKFEYNSSITNMEENRMTTLLYLLIAALAFFIIGYLLAKLGCNEGGERYLAQTPVDPVTEDDGSCEDEEVKVAQQAAAQEEAAKIAQAEQAQKEEEAAKAAQEEAEKAARQAEIEAAKEAEAEEAAKRAEEEAKAKKAAESTEQAEVEASHETEEENGKTEEPQGIAPEGLLDAPRNGEKDNLTRIKGIGVKIDAALNAIGIYHFDQIAVWTEENMAWADRELAFPGRAKRDDWVGQAKLLAAGEETEFSKRVDEGKVSSSKKA